MKRKEDGTHDGADGDELGDCDRGRGNDAREQLGEMHLCGCMQLMTEGRASLGKIAIKGSGGRVKAYTSTECNTHIYSIRKATLIPSQSRSLFRRVTCSQLETGERSAGYLPPETCHLIVHAGSFVWNASCTTPLCGPLAECFATRVVLITIECSL